MKVTKDGRFTTHLSGTFRSSTLKTNNLTANEITTDELTITDTPSEPQVAQYLIDTSLALGTSGFAKFVTESGVHETFRYTNTNDVSYTNVKLVPIVTTSKFVPTDQEYKLSQNANYASKKNKKVEIGSSVFNVGANRFIGFDSSNNVKKSWFMDWNS